MRSWRIFPGVPGSERCRAFVLPQWHSHKYTDTENLKRILY